MIAITITPTAYEAITTLPTASSQPPKGANGLIRVWLDRKLVERRGQMRDPGETYSDVILRLAKASS